MTVHSIRDCGDRYPEIRDDGLDAIAEYGSQNGLLHRYVFDPTTDQPVIWFEGTGVAASNRHYLSQDERGSVISISDSAGASIGINTYDEYGKPGATNTGRFQYTGQKWIGNAELYDYKARDYVPQLGVFAQTDPIGPADDPNLYAYVGGDPENEVDPLGEAGAPAATIIVVPGCRYGGIAPHCNAPPPSISDAGVVVHLTGGNRGYEQVQKPARNSAQSPSASRNNNCAAIGAVAGGVLGGLIGGIAGAGAGGAGGAAAGSVIPGAGTVAGLIVGTSGGASTGAAIGAGVGASAGAVLGSVMCSKGAGPSFGGNSRENRQAADARREAERLTGRRFTPAQRQIFHDRITGQSYNYQELVEEAVETLNGR